MHHSFSTQFTLSYRLYRLGWNCRLHRRLPMGWHILLSICYLYRRGHSDAQDWAQNNLELVDKR